MKGKDLTRIAFEDINVGDLTWYPRRSGTEGNRRGLVTAKGNKSILVTEHYWNYLNDPVVEKTLYMVGKGTLKPEDTYDRIRASEEGARYREAIEPLKRKGVKLGK